MHNIYKICDSRLYRAKPKKKKKRPDTEKCREHRCYIYRSSDRKEFGKDIIRSNSK